MKFIYCSACGKHLPIIRKALPSYGTIIDLIEPHECLPEPVPFDLKPVQNEPIDINKDSNKFVRDLNKLKPETVRGQIGGVDSNSLRDRRFEHTEKAPVTSAPNSVLDMLKGMDTSEPDKPIPTSDPSEE